MKTLLLILILASTLFSKSTIVSYDVKPNDNGVDVEIVFDRPYAGEVGKSRAEERIILDLHGVVIATKTVKDKVSPLLSRFMIAPHEGRTQVIADVDSEVTLQTTKTSDMRTLQLHYSGPAAAIVSSEALSADTTASQKNATLLSSKLLRSVTIAMIVILAIGWIVLRKKKHEAEIIKARWKAAIRSTWDRLYQRVQARLKGEKKSSSGKKSENRFLRYLKVFNPRNKLLTLLAALVIIAMFVPKINLYYQFEHLVKPYGVIISDEELYDKRLWLRIENGVLYYEQIESAQIGKIDVMLFLLYDRVKATDIRLSSTLESFVPVDIKEVSLQYSVLDPLRVTLKGSGDLGEISGEVHLRDRTVKVTLQPSKLMSQRYAATLKTLQADDKGGYYYESRF